MALYEVSYSYRDTGLTHMEIDSALDRAEQEEFALMEIKEENPDLYDIEIEELNLSNG